MIIVSRIISSELVKCLFHACQNRQTRVERRKWPTNASVSVALLCKHYVPRLVTLLVLLNSASSSVVWTLSIYDTVLRSNIVKRRSSACQQKRFDAL